MRRNSFETVLTLRFLFLSYDLVSYFSGLLHISWRGFLLATVVGSIPGSVTFILFGAVIEDRFTTELPGLDLPVLGLAALMFGVSLALARWFRKRKTRRIALAHKTPKAM